MPDISIVIPTLNRISRLVRAVLSVQAQSFADWQLIIVDDGSTDGTEEWASTLTDQRVRYLQTPHRGAAAARNTGVGHSSGRIVTFLDSDDEAMPGWLELVAHETAPDGPIIVCGAFVEHHEPTGARRTVLPKPMGPTYQHRVGNFGKAGIYAMHRELFDEVGGFAEGLRAGQHHELAMRLLNHPRAPTWKLIARMEPFIVAHVHQEARIRDDPEAVLSGAQYLLTHHRSLLERSPSDLCGTLNLAGVSAIRIGELGLGRRYIRQAVRTQPYSARNLLRGAFAHTPLGPQRWRT